MYVHKTALVHNRAIYVALLLYKTLTVDGDKRSRFNLLLLCSCKTLT